MAKKTVEASKYNVDKTQINHDALYVIEKLQQRNYEAYIVGGGIRDLLIHKTPKDFDVVTNATPEQIRAIFRHNSIIIGRRFRIVHVNFENINPNKMINNRPILDYHTIEVSTYRSTKVHNHTLSEHGRIMSDNNYGTQKEDASRRDFTINSLFYDPVKEVIIDYHNGLKDIKDGLIKTIGKAKVRYIEDPVRMLRAIRLAIKLELTIASDSSKPFKELKHLLKNESRGRMYEEMIKILLSGHSVRCLKALKDFDLPTGVFPLFDKIFLTKYPDKLALNVLEKTDARLKETSDISLNFVLAGLMWNMVYSLWQKNITKNNLAVRQALENAIADMRTFTYNLGITRGIMNNIAQVWLLQYDFEYPQKVLQNFSQSRFRQAWHLFSCRHEIGQVDKSIYEWWENFISADEAARIEMAKEVTSRDITKKKKRKRSSKIET